MEFTVSPGKIFKDFKTIFSFPSKFFEKSKKYKWQDAVSYLIVVSLIGNILSYLYYFSIYPQLSSNFPEIFTETVTGIGILEVIQLAVYSYFVGILGSFIWAALFMFWAFIFTKKKDFSSSYKAIVYARTPIYILGWIPLVNIAVWIYMIYLFVLSYVKYFDTSFKKAYLAVILGSLVMFGIAYYFILLAFSSI